MFLFRARFPLTTLLTKIGFFVTRKGPRTHAIVNSSFLIGQIDSEKAGELKNEQELTKKLRIHVARFLIGVAHMRP